MASVSAQEESPFGAHNYKVLLSFGGGEDTLNNFIDHLYTALEEVGFRTFKFDTEIEGGDDLKPEIEKTIKESNISIIVCSKNNISSRRFLDELVMILECRRKSGGVVVPVFYEVDLSEVRYQTGSIGEAFDRYVGKMNEESDYDAKKEWMYKLIKWREALGEAADLSEFMLPHQSIGDELKLIPKIIQLVGASTDKKIDWANREVSELPEHPYCPALVELFLQQNPGLTKIPPEFFNRMPALQVLNMSFTSIKSLPSSISRLIKLRKFYLRGCELLMELHPEIGALGNLEVLDLEGTKLICLPKEIGMLLKLTCLKVSLHRLADRYKEKKGIEAIIPNETISKFVYLKELSIDVDPDCAWWDVEVEAIVNQLFYLENLKALKLYLPTEELLLKFLNHPTMSRISNFILTVGRHENRIVSPVPRDLQDSFEKLPGCLKYVNGEGNHLGIALTLPLARALFLDSHWTIECLSMFKNDELTMEFCLLVQCNEMKTVVDGDQVVFKNLKYLSSHSMKNLETIWKGKIFKGGMSGLTTLVLRTCPKLTTIFNVELLCNLINLTELIVEDCPEIKSLVCLESDPSEFDDHFLPCLKKMSLLHLPELVSISSGLRIAPKLERMVIFNCPNLKSLSHMEVSNKDMKEIKGESLWWEELEWHKSEWSGVFVPLGRDADLMDELTEAVQTSLNIQDHLLGQNDITVEAQTEPQHTVIESESSKPQPSRPLKDHLLGQNDITIEAQTEPQHTVNQSESSNPQSSRPLKLLYSKRESLIPPKKKTGKMKLSKFMQFKS